jgi:hypothetical protein
MDDPAGRHFFSEAANDIVRFLAMAIGGAGRA